MHWLGSPLLPAGLIAAALAAWAFQTQRDPAVELLLGAWAFCFN